MSINEIMARLVDELREGDVPAPLHQRYSLALVWADLARLAGEEPPAEVAAVVDGPAIATIKADTLRQWMPRQAVAL